MEKEGCCMTDQTYVSMYAWWSSFKPIAFVMLLKDTSLPMPRPHCEDVPNKGLIRYQISELIFLQYQFTDNIEMHSIPVDTQEVIHTQRK